jgi:hypothetical protein
MQEILIDREIHTDHEVRCDFSIGDESHPSVTVRLLESSRLPRKIEAVSHHSQSSWTAKVAWSIWTKVALRGVEADASKPFAVQMCHDQRIKFAFVCFRQRFHA